MKKARGAKGPAASPRSPATPPAGAKSPAARAGSSPSGGGAKQRPPAPPASSAIETPSRFLVAAIGLEDAPSRVLERRSTQPLAVIAAALLPRLRLRPLDPVLVIGLAHHTAVAWAWPNADHAAEPDGTDHTQRATQRHHSRPPREQRCAWMRRCARAAARPWARPCAWCRCTPAASRSCRRRSAASSCWRCAAPRRPSP